MKFGWRRISAQMALMALLCASGFGIATAQELRQAAGRSPVLDMTPVRPESVGFSSQRLERLHSLMQKTVDEKQLAGVVTLLARHGKIVDFRTYGYQDLAAKTPMKKDVIFRDFSMTKPITGVAMMILYEEGKWLPSDPISKFIPEFAHLKVYEGLDPMGRMILATPNHPPTMGELMTHTAGFTYGLFGKTPVDQMMVEKRVFASKNLQEFIDKMATIPLLYQPGTKWVYSVSSDIQGYIVEKLSGQSLPDFVHDHIFSPLGMTDSGFYVPEDKRNRFASLYVTGPHGQLLEDPTGGGLSGAFESQPTMPMGGGGVVSTAADYYRFAQMLLNKGELGGTRILSPSTVHLMMSNHISLNLLNDGFGIGNFIMQPGDGWGYDGAVAFNPAEAGFSEGRDTYSWAGVAGTWFWVDPANDIVFVGMTQRMTGPQSPDLEFESRALVYQALVDPGK